MNYLRLRNKGCAVNSRHMQDSRGDEEVYDNIAQGMEEANTAPAIEDEESVREASSQGQSRIVRIPKEPPKPLGARGCKWSRSVKPKSKSVDDAGMVYNSEEDLDRRGVIRRRAGLAYG
jgi:hypothetical protein